MGILDSVVSAFTNSTAGGAANPQAAALAEHLSQILSGAQGGGLSQLVQSFEKNELGNIIQSWIGSGQNLPISAAQITQVLGQGRLGQIAAQLGTNHQDVANQLSQLLPQLVDKLTPNGQLPSGSAGGGANIASILQSLTR